MDFEDTPKGPPHTGPLTAESQAQLTPKEALGWLVAGNDRFVRGAQVERDHAAAIRATTIDQYPFAVVLACMDSRVAPELVFDVGIGDVFCIRVAGNYVNPCVLGSLEFAALKAGAKFILVMGHSGCAAVKGACGEPTPGHLGALLQHLKPAVDAVEGFAGSRTADNPIFVHSVARKNVSLTIEKIMERSPALAQAVESGRVGHARRVDRSC